MIKIAGILLLVGGFGALGGCAVLRLTERVRDLRGLILGLETLQQEIRSNLNHLEMMMTAAAGRVNGRPGEFFSFCSNSLRDRKHEPFSEIWHTALETVPLRIEVCDKAELRGLGAVLGCYDADSQVSAMAATIKRLELRLTEAKDRQSGMGKVYGTMGISTGIILAILLI